MIGLCAIIKDCNPLYLNEWIEWHQLIGVDYFFIYDNDSSTPITSTLKNVYIIPFSGSVAQLPAYNDCIQRQKTGKLPKCDWIGFIDEDEFIVVESGNINTILPNDKGVSGIALNWLTFGPSEKNDFHLPQIQKYKKTLPMSNSMNTHIKVIVRPENVSQFVNPHFCTYLTGVCKSITGDVLMNTPFSKKPVKKIAWINHYFARSREEFIAKIQRGRADCNIDYSLNQFKEIAAKATFEHFETFKIYQRIIMNKNTIITMRDDRSTQALNQLIDYLKKDYDVSQQTMIEIGSYQGESTIIFAKQFKNVIAIDPFIDNYDPYDAACNYAPLSSLVYAQFLKNINPYKNIEHIKMTSDEAIKHITEKTVLFVYIDGNHTYQQVKRDIQNYSQKCLIVGGHDYIGWHGVSQAIDATIGIPDRLFVDGSWIKYLNK